MERSPHPERSRRIWSQSRRVPPVLFTTATLTSRRRDDSLRAPQLLQRVGEGRKRRPALLRQTINAVALALEPAIEIVQENLADIGHQPGGAQHRDPCRAVAGEELGAAQRLLAVDGDDGNASDPSPVMIAVAPRVLAEQHGGAPLVLPRPVGQRVEDDLDAPPARSEEHTSELQSPDHLVCRLLLEKKK